MPDDLYDDHNNDESELSASAIFTELMRQAAARQQPPPAESYTVVQPDEDTWLEPSTEQPPEEAKPVTRPPSQRIPKTIASDTLRDEQKLEAAMEAQRIQRVKRRRERRRRKTVGTIGGFIRTVFVVLISAGLVATILTWFTDPQFLNPTVVKGLQDNRPQLIADVTSAPTIVPTTVPTPNWLQRIGIVSGHRGPNPASPAGLSNDPGAVCDDGFTEAEINFDVAQRVVSNLRALNYTVDLLDEFDPRLNNYQGAALVSIHANTCQDFGEVVSGYLVAKAASRPDGGIDAILAECLAQKYEEIVPLERRFTLTLDMTDYHTFREIHPLTPAAIIELGFMLADRDLLENQRDLLAQAITNGITCFLEPGSDYPVITPVDAIPDNFVPIETPILTPSQ